MIKKILIIGLVISSLYIQGSALLFSENILNSSYALTPEEELRLIEREAKDNTEAATAAREQAERDLATADRTGTGQAEAREALKNAQDTEEQRKKDQEQATDNLNNDPTVKAAKKAEEEGKAGDRVVTSYNRQLKANKGLLDAMDCDAKEGKRKEICEEQKKANAAYHILLQHQFVVDYCTANPTSEEVPMPPAAAAGGSCKASPSPTVAAKTAIDAQSVIVRAAVSKIAGLEKEINKEATFKVTEIYSLTGERLQKRSFLTVANTIADWLITLVSSLAVTALVIGGFMMIISGGDESRLETGKTIFTYSLIGLVVTLLAYGIIATIQSLFY